MNQPDQIPKEILRESNGGMKVVACVVLCALLVVGCAVSKVATVSANLIPVPVPQTIRLTWNPNYIFTNEFTAILRTADLTVPQSVWPVCFEGHTNQCVVPMIGTMGFFAATNELTTN